MFTYSRRIIVAVVFTIFSISGCIYWPETFIPQRASQEERYLQQLAASLKSEDWDKTGTLFSQGYHSGYEALKKQVESGWREQDLVELQFTVLNVDKTDGLMHIQAEWRKTYLNKEGKPNKSEGKSEILLKPLEEGFRILSIKGDSFF
jgi:hypothetical protein